MELNPVVPQGCIEFCYLKGNITNTIEKIYRFIFQFIIVKYFVLDRGVRPGFHEKSHVSVIQQIRYSAKNENFIF